MCTNEMGKGFWGAQGFNPWQFGIIYELMMGLNDPVRLNDGITLALPRSGELSGFCREYGLKV